MKIVNFNNDPLTDKDDVIKKLQALIERVKNNEVKALVVGSYFGPKNAFSYFIDFTGSPLTPMMTLSLCSLLTRKAQDEVLDQHYDSADQYPPEE